MGWEAPAPLPARSSCRQGGMLKPWGGWAARTGLSLPQMQTALCGVNTSKLCQPKPAQLFLLERASRVGWGGISLPIAFESVLGSCCQSCCKATAKHHGPGGCREETRWGGAGAGGPRAAEFARLRSHEPGSQLGAKALESQGRVRGLQKYIRTCSARNAALRGHVPKQSSPCSPLLGS